MAAHPDPETSVATLLADIRDENRQREKAATKWSPFTLVGAAVSIISIFSTLVAVIHGYDQLGDRIQSFGDRLIAIEGRVLALEATVQARGQARDKSEASLTAANGLQDERMSNMAHAIEQERQARTEMEADTRRADIDLRSIVSELTKSVDELHTDVKVLVDRAQRRGEIIIPEHDAKAGPAPH